ncbi:lytic transglycosylase domain-containing protein [Novosphingobium sp. 9U]|uniref:lytic transglycosylase domain-containing protein n=1 Tax=Novosphingobium sp. 9U TaxID=2653158 RepID=UPI0012EFC3DD|nr:lytic transglycosylase domain-containing protein [Novosphingobium sp. 9U]VWX49808.1 Soluble lytic murein transglycosylase-like protein [Novosphingobium sp. 9U]
MTRLLCFCCAALLASPQADARQPEVVYFPTSAAGFQIIEAGYRHDRKDPTDADLVDRADTPLSSGSIPDSPAIQQLPKASPRFYIPRWMRNNKPVSGPIFSISAAYPLTPCYDEQYRPHPLLAPRVELRRQRYYRQMAASACKAGIPIELFDALVIQESRYNPAALSSKGAVGLTQLMPATARDLGIARSWQVETNLDGRARYLRKQLDAFGAWDMALGAYNAGPGNVAKYGQVPPFRETREYVRAILTSIGMYRASRIKAVQAGHTPARTVVLTSYKR